LRPELDAPGPNGLITHLDAAFRQEIFDITEAEGEPKIKPDCPADHIGWKSMALEGDWFHPINLSGNPVF
jgi:hypothetical protein